MEPWRHSAPPVTNPARPSGCSPRSTACSATGRSGRCSRTATRSPTAGRSGAGSAQRRVAGAVAGVGVWVLFAILPFLHAGSGAVGAFLATFVAVLVFRRRDAAEALQAAEGPAARNKAVTRPGRWIHGRKRSARRSVTRLDQPPGQTPVPKEEPT